MIHSICVGTQDLSSFPPEVCMQLFTQDDSRDNDILNGTQVIINTVVSGYTEFCALDEPTEAAIQVSF